jgi:L-threonylcarbamoyladenylate synthase
MFWEKGQSEMSPVKTRVMPADDPEAIHLARRRLRSGESVAFPTDTVYGVGAHAFRPEAVAALYTVKDRPTSKAIPILVARVEDVARVARQVPAIAWELAERFWPGGLTLVLPRAEKVSPIVTAGGDTVAVRCPDHPIPLTLMSSVGAPLAATSANLSGQPSPTSARQVVEQLGGRVPLIIDGGECPGGVPSAVVDLSASPPRLLRAGAIPAGELRVLLPDLVS